MISITCKTVVELVTTGATRKVFPRRHSWSSFFISFSHQFDIFVAVALGVFSVALFTSPGATLGDIETNDRVIVSFYTMCFCSIFLCYWIFRSTFFSAISIVVGDRSKKQMIRPNTWTIVALMKCADSISNWFSIYFIRNPMRKAYLSIEDKIPVSSTLDCTNPHPALTQLGSMLRNGSILVYFFPKSVFHSFHLDGLLT